MHVLAFRKRRKFFFKRIFQKKLSQIYSEVVYKVTSKVSALLHWRKSSPFSIFGESGKWMFRYHF